MYVGHTYTNAREIARIVKNPVDHRNIKNNNNETYTSRDER